MNVWALDGKICSSPWNHHLSIARREPGPCWHWSQLLPPLLPPPLPLPLLPLRGWAAAAKDVLGVVAVSWLDRANLDCSADTGAIGYPGRRTHHT
jgi:hypothetical protein